MNPDINSLLELIATLDQEHAAKLKKTLPLSNPDYQQQSARLLVKLSNAAESLNIPLERWAEDYLHLLHEMQNLRQPFLETGRYPNESFAEVEAYFYSNPELMGRHMRALALAQFLWIDQCERMRFFLAHLIENSSPIRRYLEIGGGHGLFLSEAIDALDSKVSYTMLDISESSLQLARAVVGDRPRYLKGDVFDFEEEGWDLIVLGEVIEHLEDPRAMLKQLRLLVAPGGRLFLTTPANAPMPDHIYLFRNADEIRSLCHECGWKILTETTAYSDGIRADIAERLQYPLMFAAYLSPL